MKKAAHNIGSLKILSNNKNAIKYEIFQ
jgi:hypothetical protein